MDANENRKRVTSSYLKRQKERQVAFQEERNQRYYPTRNFTISPDLRTNISNVEKLYGVQGVNPDGKIIQDHPDDSLDDAGIGHRDIRHLNMLFPRLRHVGIVVPSSFGLWSVFGAHRTKRLGIFAHIFTEQESVSDQCRI